MGFYNKIVLPRLLDLAMRNSRLADYRQETIRAARGVVLEIGVGSGLSLPLYGAAVDRVCGIDPSPELLDRFVCLVVHSALRKTPFLSRLVQIPADAFLIGGAGAANARNSSADGNKDTQARNPAACHSIARAQRAGCRFRWWPASHYSSAR